MSPITKYVAILIGISKYANYSDLPSAVSDLPSAVNDVHSLANTIQEYYDKIFIFINDENKKDFFNESYEEIFLTSSAENTKSKIISKGISCGYSKNSYRGLVKIGANAKFARNFSQCDSFLLGAYSTASTYPYLDIWNSTSIVEHEAKISKVSEEQLFYLTQRGISVEQAVSLLINGFCKDVVNMLPMEFATEADKLLSLKLEGTVG
jgi:hypothetical protein